MQLGMPIASAGTTGGALGPGPVRLINNQKPRLLHRGFQYVTQVLRGSLTAPSGERNKEPASNHQARQPAPTTGPGTANVHGGVVQNGVGSGPGTPTPESSPVGPTD